MEPTFLNLHNFLSFKDSSIDLTPISCAAMVGENGSGKSSLLDAVTWALFGQATKGGVRELDNYVTRGEPECQVELRFRLNGDLYKVVRGRSIKRNKSTLEIFMYNGTDWQAISEKNITETQKKIEDILRMDYRTFTASALVLQGQSDSFTASMTDTERKEALGRILGLDIWDRMQELARERARNLKGEITVNDERKATLQETVSGKAALEQEKCDTSNQLTTIIGQIEKTQGEVISLETKVRQKPVIEQQLAEVEDAILKHYETIQTKEQSIKHTQDQVHQAEKGIENARAILANREKIEAAIEREAALSQEIAEYEKHSQEYMRLSEEAQALERKAATLDKKIETTIASIETEISTNEHYARTLDTVPCSGEVKNACRLLATSKKAAARVVELQAQLKEWKSKENPAVKPWQHALTAKDALGYDSIAQKTAIEKLQAVKKISALKPQLDIAAARESDMEGRISELEVEMAKLRTEIEQVIKEEKAAKIRMLELNNSLSEIKPLAQQLVETQERLAVLRREEADKRTNLGRIEQSLENIAKAEEELRELEEQLKQKREQLSVYETLDKACGKKAGVPALIVENAVPEIERLCNDMLSRMAGGRLAVRLDTQVEGKTTGTMQEVLRITVLDGGTERPYQTYSGAERFMVDLALRVALSKFLAHRAGAEIKLFVLDEGLGSCDATNRQAVMDAIQAVSQEFGKVIVITHIAELQDALLQRIEVTKGPEGSKVEVA
ncbi:SMC family ATPase [uncultured Aminobacterium sp.]|uniref:AAA family ATPase n=1 Tax=uncultured Aminobacterium sp. TaxID=548265 RepID=UPI0025960E72|nr:SMC family ATPase [uncultured Aminobacterium sp.]